MQINLKNIMFLKKQYFAFKPQIKIIVKVFLLFSLEIDKINISFKILDISYV